jgi:hypothetical protein
MRLPPGRNQRLYVRRRARHHIRLAEIAVVGQQRFGPAKLFRPCSRDYSAAQRISRDQPDLPTFHRSREC